MKETLIKRFLSFISQVKKSPKLIVKHILKTISLDVRSTTGGNLRNILLLTGKSSIDKLDICDYKSTDYHPIPQEELWRPNLILEITDVKFNQLNVEGFSQDELEEILSYACTS